MVLLYLASISNNIHLMSGIFTTILTGILLLFFGLYISVDCDNTAKEHIKKIAVKLLIVYAIFAACFVLTPSNYKYDLDTKYIQKNSELELKVMQLEKEIADLKYGM